MNTKTAEPSAAMLHFDTVEGRVWLGADVTVDIKPGEATISRDGVTSKYVEGPIGALHYGAVNGQSMFKILRRLAEHPPMTAIPIAV